MDADPSKYLLDDCDGLITNNSKPHSLQKWATIRAYINTAMTAVKKRHWQATFYIDLQSGPGKNRIETECKLGSALIALTTPQPFTHYRFNEIRPKAAAALRTRVSASPIRERVQVSELDANEAVNPICDEIAKIDRNGPTFNIAVLDPFGLELEWRTVRRLAQVRRMDLLINFSTSGVRRNVGAGNTDVIDRFFGTPDWRTVYDPRGDSTSQRRALIDFYLQRLTEFGYVFDPTQSPEDREYPVKNRKGVQIYSMIYASKHELGMKLWKAVLNYREQRRLL
jgi:three-Cys-motif partner protein